MGYSKAIYMVPKIALITDDGLISVFNRSLAGATGIGGGGWGGQLVCGSVRFSVVIVACCTSFDR